MRTRVSFAAVFVACVCVTGAHAGGPGDVYNDFAADGKLSCNHSRADLVAVLRSGSLNQYGDPLTLARLKLAVRKQLAGGCRKRGSQQGGTASTGASRGGTTTGAGGQRSKTKTRRRQSHPKQAVSAAPNRRASAGGGSSGFVAGRGLIVGLLVAVLALGGWLTKRALAARD